MSTEPDPESPELTRRIAGLIRTLREADRELQDLTGGEPDRMATAGGQPYLLRDAQERLRESELAQRQLAETQLAILNALPAHVALLDPAGRILAANEAWRHTAARGGLPGAGFAVGTNYLALCQELTGDAGRDGGHIAEGLRRVLAGTVPTFSFEYQGRAGGGTQWFRIVITPVRQGEFTGAVVTHLDITEAKSAEEALRRSEAEQRQLAGQLETERARLLAAQAVAKIGSWETDLDTLEVIWSGETHRIFETDPDSFVPTHPAFLERVHPDDRAAVDAAFRDFQAARTTAAIEHRLLFPDGRIKVVEERWRTNLDDAGRPVRALGTCQDITGRKQIEEALRASEERFRQLAENINAVFWITDPAKDRMIYVSPAYEEIWGRSCASLYQDARNWIDAVHPEDRAQVLEAARTRQVMGAYDETYRIVRPDGTLRWVRDRAFPVRNAAGEIYRLVGIASDVTARKKLEAEFLRAQRMESIGTLAGGIAHDLNNVLAPIMMAIGMLRPLVQGEEGQALLTTLEGSAQRGADLVRQVLTFARGMEGARVPLRPGDLVQDLQRIVRDTFPKNISFSLDLPGDLWSVTGDPTQLHQVLMNLCVNARDAMPRGGQLSVTLANAVLDQDWAAVRPGARPGRFVVISVVDTGGGIPAEDRDRIFEPFYTTKAPGEGTGLGLSTTQAIVQRHGGYIEVQSETGRGSAFRVYLPAGAEPASAPASEQPPAPGPPGGHGELILVVDDEEAIRTVARRTLERAGYRVRVAAHGAEAAALYAEHEAEIALVLTDMAMPIMDGPALVAALRAMNPAVRIIGSSGLTTRETMARAAGLEHFVTKPYTADTLLGTIGSVLGRH